MIFSDFLSSIGLKKGQHVIVHSSFKKIKGAFPGIQPSDVINSIQQVVTEEGSVIFPTFTYCFKKTLGKSEIFEPEKSKSKVGLLSETFRLSKDVIRTSSPTHSFALWGNVSRFIEQDNSPESPLGEGSVLHWLANQSDSFILMLGTNFSSLSFCHYLEIEFKVPWFDFFPWDYLGVLPIGVSVKGEQMLKEVPGCSKSFTNFEKYLLRRNLLEQNFYSGLDYYFLSTELLHKTGKKFFSECYSELLCDKGTCPACDIRRENCL